jgi:hypothetical protein
MAPAKNLYCATNPANFVATFTAYNKTQQKIVAYKVRDFSRKQMLATFFTFLLH